MYISKFILCVLLISVSVHSYSTEHDGFDEICKIYTEALNSSLSQSEQGLYIFDNISKRVTNTDALMTHSAIPNLDPNQRYGVFKEAAEYSLKHNWDCAAKNTLMKE